MFLTPRLKYEDRWISCHPQISLKKKILQIRMISPYGVSWRIMSIFWLIIIKPLIRKFAEINPSVDGLSARSLPSDWHCNWSNYIFATLPSTEMLQVAPRRLGMTSTLEQCFPMHSPNRKRFEIPAWLYWRVIGMGVAGERKYTL